MNYLPITWLLVISVFWTGSNACNPAGCCGTTSMNIEVCKNWCASRSCNERCDVKCTVNNYLCYSTTCADLRTCRSSTADLYNALNNGAFDVLDRNNPEYEEKRKVFNAACTAKPLYIVLPKTPQDVSHILKTAKEYNTPISVRSGGHSYTCNGIKQDAIHIVMTNFNRIERVSTAESESGDAAWLGTGAIWGDVLRTLDPEHTSYPHGQCRSVGVGGFLLGGGVNWLGTWNKYGYGAEGILRMNAVLADGSIVSVDKDKTTYEDGRVVQHTSDNNLFFGLRGAGSSLAIVTEFLYILHDEPETRPAIILVWLDDEADVEHFLQVTKSTDKYSFMINHQISADGFWERPILAPLMRAFPLAMQALKVTNGKQAFPVQVMVTDITLGAGRTTSPVPAVQFLKANGVEVVLDSFFNTMAIQTLSGGQMTGGFHFVFDRVANILYEEIEKEQEVWRAGEYSSISLNYGSLTSTAPFAGQFIHDSYTGMKRTLFLSPVLAKQCEFCFWMLHFRHRQGQTQISSTNPISTRKDEHQDNSVEINLTCMFKPENTQCTQVVNEMRAKIDNNLAGQEYSKYYNFPSCSTKQDIDWKKLYWGDNVGQLMSIKQYWDPQDMFHHCQSLKNTDQSCCPFPHTA